jgi:hypothetical protein
MNMKKLFRPNQEQAGQDIPTTLRNRLFSVDEALVQYAKENSFNVPASQEKRVSEKEHLILYSTRTGG